MERTDLVPHRGVGVLELLTASLFLACVLGACYSSRASCTPLFSAPERSSVQEVSLIDSLIESLFSVAPLGFWLLQPLHAPTLLFLPFPSVC